MYVTCIGCNHNCDLNTLDRNIFRETEQEYVCIGYCPCGGCWVDVDIDELERAYTDDNE